ncbi:hypothetical protein EZS27_003895 [termite gut metagenome]|uniref:Bro-N domain-containing protein n=1 Tax=termite gut metagenome TaxID=433724 RepID=A0A5J4SS74_9ZZZZ
MTVIKNEIKIFESPDFGKIRTSGTSEQPLFCLTDLCKALSIKNTTQVARRLDDEERPMLDIGRDNQRVGNSLTTFVTESGMYAVILRSDKPEARQFRKWITSEVLPSIRKTGQYSNDALIQSKLDMRDEIIAFLKKDNERLFELVKSMNDTDKKQNNTVKLIFDQHCTIANMMMGKMYGA